MEIKYSIVISGQKNLHYFEQMDGDLVEFIHLKTNSTITVWNSRIIGFLKSKGSLVFFFDQDVKRPETKKIKYWAKQFQKSACIGWGGQYLNPPEPEWSLKAYNRLCDLWSSTRETFLGGLFAIKKSEATIALFEKLPLYHQWGGEDLSLSEEFKKQNLAIEFPDFFCAEHLANTSLQNNIRRAWIHGCRKWELRHLKPNWQWPQFKTNDILFVPFFFLHFFVLFLGYFFSALTLKTILWHKNTSSAHTAPIK